MNQFSNSQSYIRILTEQCDVRYQFTCNSGRCIDKSLRCDGRADCFDETDEVGCSESGRLQNKSIV